MKERKFDKIIVCKRELEVIRFIQTGSNNFWEAFYSYTHRKKKFRDVLPIVSWFNSTLKSFHSKGVFLEVPFVISTSKKNSALMNWDGNWYGFYWINPGVSGSKANFECFTLHDAQMEQRKELNKII